MGSGKVGRGIQTSGTFSWNYEPSKAEQYLLNEVPSYVTVFFQLQNKLGIKGSTV